MTSTKVDILRDKIEELCLATDMKITFDSTCGEGKKKWWLIWKGKRVSPRLTRTELLVWIDGAITWVRLGCQ